MGLNITEERAQELIMIARRPWFEEMGIDIDADEEADATKDDADKEDGAKAESV